MKWFTNLFKRKYHWYVVKFTYKGKDGQVKFDFTQYVGVQDQNTILNAREVKKIEQPLHLYLSSYDKHLLNNGTLISTPKTYLGYMTKPKKGA